MDMISERPLATQRATLRGSRAAVRAAIDEQIATGRVLTYTDPVPDPAKLGRFMATIVALVEPDPTAPRPAGTDLVPARPPARTTPPATRPERAASRAGRVYRRTRAVKRSTVARTFYVAAGLIVAGGVAYIAIEIAIGLIELAHWIAAHGAIIIGAGVLLLALILFTPAGRSACCHVCGR